jgi:UDP-glucuronate 4-epimerase
MRVLVTGTAGFIGFHVAERLLERGDEVVGVDNVNAYYDPTLKEARLQRLARHTGFCNLREDIANAPAMKRIFDCEKPQRIVHLAAQAGVRYSLENPRAYVDSNITGFLNILEGCRHHDIEHLVYASTSSVYGSNLRRPSAVREGADHPVSFYAATKRANELMAHSYSHLFGMPATGLRFFTVYGPWGRPDMALFIFTRKMLAGEPIPVFNHGHHRRDFTYVDDIAGGVLRVLDRAPEPDVDYDWMSPTPEAGAAPIRVYNIGHGQPVSLLDYIQAIEAELGIKAEMEMLPLQLGDVETSAADVSALKRDFGYVPETTVRTGVARFVAWYRAYYGV